METTKPTIDPYLFEKHFEAFKNFVEEQSNVPLRYMITRNGTASKNYQCS